MANKSHLEFETAVSTSCTIAFSIGEFNTLSILTERLSGRKRNRGDIQKSRDNLIKFTLQMFPAMLFTVGKFKYRDLTCHHLFVRGCLKYLTCRYFKIKAETCGMTI